MFGDRKEDERAMQSGYYKAYRHMCGALLAEQEERWKGAELRIYLIEDMTAFQNGVIRIY